jgi:hypothetical protein
MNADQPTEGVVIVRGGAGGLAHEITAGSHRFFADEPATAGGTDSGPTPVPGPPDPHIQNRHPNHADISHGNG